LSDVTSEIDKYLLLVDSLNLWTLSLLSKAESVGMFQVRDELRLFIDWGVIGHAREARRTFAQTAL